MLDAALLENLLREIRSFETSRYTTIDRHLQNALDDLFLSHTVSECPSDM